MRNKIKKFDLKSTENQPTSSTLQPAFGTLQSAFVELQPAFVKLPVAFGRIDEPELDYKSEKVFEECQKQSETKYEKSANISSSIVKDIDNIVLPDKGMNFLIRLIGVKEIIKEESDGEYRRTV